LKEIFGEKETCHENLIILGPSEVTEGESFTLTPALYDDHDHDNLNMSYNWDYPINSAMMDFPMPTLLNL
jgi:hypothetical protein